MRHQPLILPSVAELDAEINQRRGELVELKEILRLARIRELRVAAGLGAAPNQKRQSKRGSGNSTSSEEKST